MGIVNNYKKHKAIKEINRIIDSLKKDDLGISVAIKSGALSCRDNRSFNHVVVGDYISFYSENGQIFINTNMTTVNSYVPCYCVYTGENLGTLDLNKRLNQVNIKDLEKFILIELVINAHE